VTNRVNILKWVRALESGQYEQGSGYLAKGPDRQTTQYCCLGVACEVAIANGVQVPRWARKSYIDGTTTISYGERATNTVLPREVQEWLGVFEPDPALTVPVIGDDVNGDDVETMVSISAADLNDGNHDLGHYGFPEIAQAIRNTFLAGENHG